ncbi:MAG: ribose 5-phosphate isomerase B [Bryobacteraceae bacterium]|nr:ribose 5-phosphate isomerase B [Bryobacteraceae bacterium]
MKIALGADHAGFALKEQLRERLKAKGHEVLDVGTTSTESTDYPDFAEDVAHRVAKGDCDRGLLVCSTGVGMSIAANKVNGIRAALAYNEDEVRLTRAHNDANVLALSAKYTDAESADKLVEIFLNTPFDGGRHERRVNKIKKLEETKP